MANSRCEQLLLCDIANQTFVTTNFSTQFESLLAARAGLQVRAQDRALLERTLQKSAQSRQMQVAQYLGFLESAVSSSEWNRLFALLTNQESYFFRDCGQFALLRERILPELIARNGKRRTLKLWSAGCSTGEEAYSLAMTLDALMPSQESWDIEIQATDLSETALQKARAATYSDWSFRNTPDDVRDRYFQKHGTQWILDARLRGRVTFRQSNLLDDVAVEGSSDCDLILCRNVFIYFHRQAVAQAVRKLRDTLCIGGYLVTGHAELHDVSLQGLEARSFAQSVVHQRVSSTRSRLQQNSVNTPASATNLVPDTASSTPPAFSTTSRTPNAMQTVTARGKSTFVFDSPEEIVKSDALERVRSARDWLRTGRSREALSLLQKVLQDTSAGSSLRNKAAHFGAHCLMAQYQANNACYEQALASCALATALDALAPLPYHVQARIEEERGHSERARELLKKVLYLAPRSVVAMVELSAIYIREGDAKRAKSWRDAALQLLIEYSNDEIVVIPEWSLDEMQRAGRLGAHLQNEK